MNKRLLAVCISGFILFLAIILVYLPENANKANSQAPSPSLREIEKTSAAQDSKDSADSLNSIKLMTSSGDIHRQDRWQLLSALEISEIPEAFNLLQSLPEGPNKALLLEGLFRHWRSLDPKQAAAASEAIFARDTRESIQFGVMETLSHNDPQAAFKWLQKHPEWSDRFGRVMLRQVVLAGMRENPAQLLAKYAAIESPALRREAGRIWASERAAQMSASIIFEELYTLPHGSEEQLGSAEGIIHALVEKGDLEQAQTLIATVPAGHPLRAPALKTLSETYLLPAPAKGLEYMSQLSPGADLDSLIENYTKRWTEAVLTETHGTGVNPSTFTAGLNDPAGKIAALTGYYTALGRYDPETALQAAFDLPSEQGARVIESTLTIWSVVDRKTMHELLDNPLLSSSQAKTFRERFPILSEAEKSEQFAF